jgi:hypothetical protein
MEAGIVLERDDPVSVRLQFGEADLSVYRREVMRDGDFAVGNAA